MTTISSSMFPLPPNWSAVSKLEDQLDALSQQLASGQKSSTLSGLGSARFSDLTVRSQLSRISGYDNNINTVNLRLGSMGNVLGSISKINADARDAAPGGYGTNNANLTTGPGIASQQLDQVLSSLDTDINGHYLFGGGTTETPPVQSTDTIMNGAGGLAGFKTVAAQRLQADQGADGLGRLTLSTPAGSDTTTLAEDAASPFGFKLASVGSSSPAVTVTQPDPTTPPAALTVQFTGQPAAGDTVNIGLKLPDGTGDSIAMKAVTGAPQNPGEFQIGATPAETAANFNTALNSSLQTKGSTTLAAASNYAAANDFFNGNGQSVQRAAVGTDGTYATSTGYETPAQTANDTVQWYQGESGTDPRASVSTKVDDSVNVNYGVEANESGFTDLIKNLAVQSIQTYSTATDADTAASKAKFDAIASRTSNSLSTSKDSDAGSLAGIGVDLGLAQTSLKNLSDQHASYSAQLQDIVGDAETADPNEVASQLLQLQTHLSASFSATAMINQLQLVNYLK